MKRSVKVTMLGMVALIGLSACSIDTTIPDPNYTGKAVVESAQKAKRSCKLSFTAEDGSHKAITINKDNTCYSLTKGTTLNIVKSKIQK